MREYVAVFCAGLLGEEQRCGDDDGHGADVVPQCPGDGREDPEEGENDRAEVDDQGQDDVLPDLCHGLSGYEHQVRDPLDAVADEDRVRGFHRSIGPDTAHGDARKGAGERECVVDAVAEQADLSAGFCLLPDGSQYTTAGS